MKTSSLLQAASFFWTSSRTAVSARGVMELLLPTGPSCVSVIQQPVTAQPPKISSDNQRIALNRTGQLSTQTVSAKLLCKARDSYRETADKFGLQHSESIKQAAHVARLYLAAGQSNFAIDWIEALPKSLLKFQLLKDCALSCSDIASAIQNQMLVICSTNSDNQTELSDHYAELGYLHLMQGNIKSSVEAYSTAEKLDKHSPRIAQAWNPWASALSVVHCCNGDVSLAIDLLASQEPVRHSMLIQDRLGAVVTANNLAFAYALTGDTDKAGEILSGIVNVHISSEHPLNDVIRYNQRFIGSQQDPSHTYGLGSL